MKKIILKVCLLSGILVSAFSAQAQLAAVLPQAPLPTVTGAANPVLRPQNAGSSTMQNVNFGGPINNLYVHSWDVFSVQAYHGIAWRRTNNLGATLNQGYLQLKYADDIDVALYQSGANYYVLAAYYYAQPGVPALNGHYYDVYQFTALGLAPVSTMNLLALSATFGRINVDANTPYGIAIAWSTPGVGINVKVATLPAAVFGANVLLPGTAGFKDPDICIRRGPGGSGTGLDLQIVYVNNANNQIRCGYVPFFTLAPYTLESVVNTPATFGVPRIDCPDIFGAAQKWTYVYSEYNYSAGTASERIWAVVKNTGWSVLPTQVLVHNTSYLTGFFQQNNPVIAYDVTATRITVGWITKDNTAVIPGTLDTKYVAQMVADPGTAAPASVAATYMMVSNITGGPAPVLAFSGQNNASGFNGLHAAFSHYNVIAPSEYGMFYRDRPWSSATFKMLDEEGSIEAERLLTVHPNPFVNVLTVTAPQKGNYSIKLFSIDGRVVYENEQQLDNAEKLNINTESFISGLYMLKIVSAENNIDFTQKLVK